MPDPTLGRMGWRSTFSKVALLVGSTTIALLAAERMFRWALFGNDPAFAALREPGKYADPFDESDNWKLYYLFGGTYRPPDHPHPLLGWIGDFGPRSLMHNMISKVGERRPVLLYGDSYAQCMPEVACFEDLLNTDSAFARSHYLLNYGVGGYGVDQIELLFENTFERYDRPMVIFSLMATDLDRSILDWRTGQKPMFRVDDDQLRLEGVPIDPDPAHYMTTHGPRIRSFLWRRFLFSDANVLPDAITSAVLGRARIERQKIALNTLILQRAIGRLRAARIPFFFVVFHYVTMDQPQFMVTREDNWRDRTLRSFLDGEKVPYIWSKDIIRRDTAWTGTNLDRYMLMDNGHPTTYLNTLIAAEMKRLVFAVDTAARNVPNVAAEDGYEQRVRDLMTYIPSDSAWWRKTRDHALVDGGPLELRLRKEAEWSVEQGSRIVEEAIARYTTR